uniref:meprin A subunit beta-like n=1 Tax=Styela clava TaxID=7725 RepID=UPI001939EC2B|nr:meprin A subunit beta-like [Styela clava]
MRVNLPHFAILLAIISRVQSRNLTPMDVVKGRVNEGLIPDTYTEGNIFDIEPSLSIPDINAREGVLGQLKEGDLMQKDTRNTIVDDEGYKDYFWPNKTIPVAFTNATTLFGKAAIDEARREYELRTCLSFPARTNEENYLIFDQLSGCWSYVGMQGGEQTVSIGRGCEDMSTVEHELMHAIGVWHEQSRADRDDYIEIMWDAISPDMAYNFNNYPYNETDNRRVAYDFDSVMHYGKTAFTEDGNITIRTRDPKFQDVIGQRSTFSPGDVTKIKRMYDCSDTVRISNTVNYEKTNAGGYSEDNSDVMWLRHNIETSDASGPTTKYLPKFDSTFGTEGEGSFMYLDTSTKFPGLSGGMKSMRYTTTVEKQCLEFSHYINLNEGSGASMAVYLATLDPVSGEITSYGQPLKMFGGKSIGAHDVEWNVERMTISAPESFRIVFWGKTGGFYNDIIAVDDVSVLDKECDTSFFTVPQYSMMADMYEVNEYSTSPIMYTGNPGYAFQIMIYPNGTQSAVDAGNPGYFGVFFRLVGGKYDDELEWPFNNQFVRLVLTDQGPKPLSRMNHYSNFLTDSASPFFMAYQKPSGLGSFNDAVGYRYFISKESFHNRRYLKHDVAYFSVQVTDMRPFENSDEISAQLTNPVVKNLRNLPNSLHYPMEYEMDESQSSHSHHHSYDTDDAGDNEMISVKTASIIIIATSGAVFLFMAVLICLVASSYKKKIKQAPVIMNNVRYGPGLAKDTSVKYAERPPIM